ncbi:hypothetical protein EYF80_001887 [Liparis tanakae]|uniref:Uncharacterized protein n=1 Tax=Liparis tanakae TaxID=230148 RepID=A0A4Z2JDT9_9TELE|nr:hypothetical protein EYF80_001887 [Liparis tanakae]
MEAAGKVYHELHSSEQEQLDSSEAVLELDFHRARTTDSNNRTNTQRVSREKKKRLGEVLKITLPISRFGNGAHVVGA